MPPYISLYLPHIPAISPSYLRYISQALHEPEAISDAALLATALDCLEHLCKHRTEP